MSEQDRLAAALLAVTSLLALSVGMSPAEARPHFGSANHGNNGISSSDGQHYGAYHVTRQHSGNNGISSSDGQHYGNYHVTSQHSGNNGISSSDGQHYGNYHMTSHNSGSAQYKLSTGGSSHQGKFHSSGSAQYKFNSTRAHNLSGHTADRER